METNMDTQSSQAEETLEESTGMICPGLLSFSLSLSLSLFLHWDASTLEVPVAPGL